MGILEPVCMGVPEPVRTVLLDQSVWVSLGQLKFTFLPSLWMKDKVISSTTTTSKSNNNNNNNSNNDNSDNNNNNSNNNYRNKSNSIKNSSNNSIVVIIEMRIAPGCICKNG